MLIDTDRLRELSAARIADLATEAQAIQAPAQRARALMLVQQIRESTCQTIEQIEHLAYTLNYVHEMTP